MLKKKKNSKKVSNDKPKVKKFNLQKVSIQEVEANRSKAYNYLFC